MPEIDVSAALTDPDMLDRLTCTRTAQVLSGTGVVVTTQQQFLNFYGVVTSDRGFLLKREAAGSRVEGTITVVTKFRLQAQSPGFTADIVTWDGRQYTVVHTDPYNRYGTGFIQATCDLIPVTG